MSENDNLSRPVSLVFHISSFTGNLLVRNAFLNFFGQVVPLLVGVVTIPLIVRILGTERFGLLSLVWIILGYFNVFDLGLGRATTKFVAEAVGKGKLNEIPRLVWTAVTTQAVLGVVGGVILIIITPFLVRHILNIPEELIGEAIVIIHLLAFSVPIVLVSGSFRGVLEAFQRFDLINAVRIPVSSLTYLLPLIGFFFGFGLPGIVVLILFARVFVLVAFVVLNLRLLPQLRKYSSSFSLFPRLFSFGGWVTVSSIVGPILVYLDRFMISSILSVSALAYYAAPYEAVTRLWIIPTSLTMALFPAFSTLSGSESRENLVILFARSIKYILLVLGPIVLVITLFAKEILHIWLGSDFAMESTVVLQVLALGVLLNSFAHVPFALLQGVGRPDLPAKFHLFELPIYIGSVWFLISKWGITGAAIAWALRIALDTCLLFVATFRGYKLSLRFFLSNGTVGKSLVLLLFGNAFYGLKVMTRDFSLFVQFVSFIALLVLFVWFVWRNILDASDKEVILGGIKSWWKMAKS
ncbi:flippase [Thermatribacter velox]|uniref:Flippase n=1 Tax=Thermatribacter velox TaxID=3039681 RepID=A0ABZ2YA62_9BACT